MRGIGGVAYGPSKSALNAVTVAFAQELADTNIKVSAACPGHTATDPNGHSGQRTVDEAAKQPVWLALLGEDGPHRHVLERRRHHFRGESSTGGALVFYGAVPAPLKTFGTLVTKPDAGVLRAAIQKSSVCDLLVFQRAGPFCAGLHVPFCYVAISAGVSLG